MTWRGVRPLLDYFAARPHELSTIPMVQDGWSHMSKPPTAVRRISQKLSFCRRVSARGACTKQTAYAVCPEGVRSREAVPNQRSWTCLPASAYRREAGPCPAKTGRMLLPDTRKESAPLSSQPGGAGRYKRAACVRMCSARWRSRSGPRCGCGFPACRRHPHSRNRRIPRSCQH